MNFKRKLLFILIFFIIIPLNTFAYTKKVIPGGENIGITIKSKGIMVVGFYEVDNNLIAKTQGVKLGDMIVSINDKSIESIEELSNEIKTIESEITIKLGIIRNNNFKYMDLTLTREKNGIYKTGMYVKDSITGIGTITFITLDGMYGALGHEIIESNTLKKFEVKTGEIYDSKITSIDKAKQGIPGEKNAQIFYNNVKGNVIKNVETGIFGNYKDNINPDEAILVSSLDDVKVGKASILTTLNNNEKKAYDIEIISIDKKSSIKNFAIKIIDEELIAKTGGIIKGMSGSPIIQNGKIIGAVTHAVIDNPTNGYGISIIKMLDNIE